MQSQKDETPWETKVALTRYTRIVPILNNSMPDASTRAEMYRRAAMEEYKNENGEPETVSPSTVKRWVALYEQGGFDALKPKSRNDKGKTRSLDNDMKGFINTIIHDYPKLPCTQIYKRMEGEGFITPTGPSLSTVTRYAQAYKAQNGGLEVKNMQRFELPHINEVWYGDTTYLPMMKINGEKVRLYCIALIDDTSRTIVGAQIFEYDRFSNVAHVMYNAILKFGLPKFFSFDNGTPYNNDSMKILIANLGSSLWKCKPYTPTDKAKIERVFRTIKEQYIYGLRVDEETSIEQLNEGLDKFVLDYNNRKHSSLEGQTPLERFNSEIDLKRTVSSDVLDKAFLLSKICTVSADRVVTLFKKKFEVPVKFVKRKVVVRYDVNFENFFVEDPENGSLIKIELLDMKANSRSKRGNKNQTFLSGGYDDAT